jgi:hypothetical protein
MEFSIPTENSRVQHTISRKLQIKTPSGKDEEITDSEKSK